MNPALTRLFARRLVVCLGPGGVGKTTTSAALALGAALTGRAVDVMTIDPAPRLLDALRLDPAAFEPQVVALDGLGGGQAAALRALRLDPKHTFDRLIGRYAPSLAARDAILANRIYRNLSDALAGVADYMAIERLLELHDENASELIVLDTPPAREALDFLDAPRRLLDLLNSRAVSLLGASGTLVRGGLSMVDFAARAVLSAFDRVTGLHLLRDVQGFVASFDGMYPGFAERAARARALLRGEQSAAVIVTTAENERIAQLGPFLDGLHAAEMQVAAIVLNRVMDPLPAAARSVKRGAIDRTIERKLARNLRDFRALKQREASAKEALRALAPPGASILTVPELDHEPRTLADLAALAERIAPL